MKPVHMNYNGAPETVSTFCFVMYIYFLIDFFLHLSARIPPYALIRPTLLLVIIISLSLILQRQKLSTFSGGLPFKSIKILFAYLVISLPLVEWPGSVVQNLALLVKAIVFLFFTALIIDTEKRLKVFLFVFVSCQVFRAIEPLFLNLTSGYWGDKTYLGSGEFANRLAGAPSDVVNPNGLGFVIVTAIPFLHYLLWGAKWKSKVLYIAILPAIMYALLLTMSRGAMVAFLVVVWMVFKNSKHKLSLVIVGLLSAVVMWGVLNDVQKDRYLSLVSSDTQGAKTVDGRWQGMVNEFSLGAERPIVGHGLGTTGEAKFNSGMKRQAAHNLYAELLIEIGIIGFIIFIIYIVSIYNIFIANQNLISKQSKLKTNSEYDFYNRLNLALTTVFWMYVVYSINYYGLSVYYWYLFGGLTIAFGRVLQGKSKFEQGSYD